jgi:hypothetical protein
MFFDGGDVHVSDNYDLIFPWKPILAIQARVAKPMTNPPHIELDRSAPAAPRATGWIDLWLRATGLPEGTLLHCDAAELSVDNAAGSSWRSPTIRLPTGILRAPGPCHVILYLSPDSARKFGSQPVRIHVGLYMTIFGRGRSTAIPLDRNPVAVPGLGQCAASAVPDAPAVAWCRVPFRWPSRVVFARGSPDPLERFTTSLSYSPFPADLSFNPVETRWSLAKPDSNGMVTIGTTETMWFVRSDLEIGDVRLTDF